MESQNKAAAELAVATARYKAAVAASQREALAEGWQAVRDADTATEALDGLIEGGQAVDYFMQALSTANDAYAAAETMRQSTVVMLSTVFNVPHTELARILGVSHTTVMRWVKNAQQA